MNERDKYRKKRKREFKRSKKLGEKENIWYQPELGRLMYIQTQQDSEPK